MTDINIDTILETVMQLKSNKSELETQIKNLNETITDIDSKINSYEKLLMDLMIQNNLNELKSTAENIFATKFSKASASYSNEPAIIDILKNRFNGICLKEKYSVAIDKNSLKKAVKENSELAESLSSYMEPKVTEYVVVTSAENHAKMLEHIEANSNK